MRVRKRQLFGTQLVLGLGIAAAGLAMAGCSKSETPRGISSPLWDIPAGSFNYADHSDIEDLTHDIVVSLAKTATGTSVCTGVLISPRLVLTAASCKLDSKAGATPYVRIGAASPFTQTATTSSFLTFASTPANEPSLSGQDLGLLVLNDYVFEHASPKHPALQAPSPTGTLSNGQKTYSDIVLTGWSPLDAGGQTLPWATHRQAMTFSSMSMWPYATISTGLEPFWAIKPYTDIGVPKSGLAAGDNGAPLVAVDATGRWNTIGIGSIIGDPPDAAVRSQGLPAISSCAPITPGTATSCDAWVDVTAVATRNWILANAADTTRTTKWRNSHPALSTTGNDGLLWIGDVDYTGACDTVNDPDCDHILTHNPDGTARDNCPSTYNPDQTDTGDTGTGDACCANPCASGCCGTGEYCDLWQGECVPMQPSGCACNSGSECASGCCYGVPDKYCQPIGSTLCGGGGDAFAARPVSYSFIPPPRCNN